MCIMQCMAYSTKNTAVWLAPLQWMHAKPCMRQQLTFRTIAPRLRILNACIMPISLACIHWSCIMIIIVDRIHCLWQVGAVTKCLGSRSGLEPTIQLSCDTGHETLLCKQQR
jgi:hypothetical protein